MGVSIHDHLSLFPVIMNSEMIQSLPPMVTVPSVTPTGFPFWLEVSGGCALCPLISPSTFSNRSLPTDVWRVEVMTSPHHCYTGKQS